MSVVVATALLVLLMLQGAEPRPADIRFAAHLIDPGASESAAVVDINHDGRLDIASGEYWYEAPSWRAHRFRSVGFSSNYIDSFSLLPVDVNADGYPDLADVSWFAKKLAWWKNPGRVTADTPWGEASINACCNIEFARLVDLDNDGRANEVLAQENGTGQSWYEVLRGSWVKHVIAERSFGHGIGAGDVNGDRRADVLTPRGWLEAPMEPRSGPWTFHSWEAANPPLVKPASVNPDQPTPVLDLGFMHVTDVNGDGRNDVVAGAAHDYGVYWFEQMADGTFVRRVIDSSWSQAHASTLVDLNGDGRLDLVTGKRFMAHNGTDPGEREPLGLYWYESRLLGGGRVEWIRHVIDYGGRLGGGMQIPVIDLDGDGDLDIVCAGKSGLFVVENLTAAVPRR